MRPEFAYLVTRPFWLDEWHTALVANRASLSQVFSDLYRGSDMGPPLLHVVAWSVARFTGHLTPVAARLISLTAVLLALLFVFLALRRRFGLAASAAGVLAVASHETVVAHAFELRYYCLWLAFAAGFAWALGLDNDQLRSRRRDLAVAVLSVLLCMSHWLAAMSLGLMCLGAMASYGRDWRAGLRRVMPAAAGFIVLAMSVPLVLAQRASVAETSWMPDASIWDVLVTLEAYWFRELLLFVLLAILGGMLIARLKGPPRAAFSSAVQHPATAAMLSLFALPLLMAILSTRYPAMHIRYSIVTVLAWAPMVAIVVHSLGHAVQGRLAFALLRASRGLVFLVLLFYMWRSVLSLAIEASVFTYSVTAGRSALARACAMNLPVVFEVRHLMYPSTDGPSRQWARCDTRYVAVAPATLERMYSRGSHLPRFFRFENEIASLHQRIYGYPRVSTQAQLDSVPRFLVVGWDDSFPQGYKNPTLFGRAVFPNHRVTRITEDLALFERR